MKKNEQMLFESTLLKILCFNKKRLQGRQNVTWSCCSFCIRLVDVNTKFTTRQLVTPS